MTTELSAKELIAQLGLIRHPEGGWFRECYRSRESVAASALPGRFGAARSFCTSIYFLLEHGYVSALHRIKTDELWHFYAGSPLTVHAVTPEGAHHSWQLGAHPAAGETFQAAVPAGCWFGAEVRGEGAFALVGCTVAPGFDFADFEMAERDLLLADHPQHRDLICRLTRG